MDNTTLLILMQKMHINEKENTFRDNSFIYNKISLNSDLVFTKTFMLILDYNHGIVSEGHWS